MIAIPAISAHSRKQKRSFNMTGTKVIANAFRRLSVNHSSESRKIPKRDAVIVETHHTDSRRKKRQRQH